MIELSSERQIVEPLKFTSEQRAELVKRGFKIFKLKGESISSLKKKGIAFWAQWHEGLGLESLQSKQSEVAIIGKNPFLPDSGNKNIEEQLRITEQYGQSLSNEIPGIKAVIGTAADYIDLDFCFKEETGGSLFRRFGSFDNASCSTLIKESNSLFVGRSYDDSVVVSYRLGKNGYSDIKVMPLIVPIEI